MLRRPNRTRHLPLAVAAAILAGCAGPVVTGTPSVRIGGGEGRVSSDAFGNVNISVAGKNFRLSTADLKPIGDLTIQAGATFYTLRDGRFHVPEGALRDLKANDGAFIRVFVPGYVPKQVWIGQSEESIVVSPQKVVAIMLAMPPSGGQLKAEDDTFALNIGAGMLTKPGTKVAMSTYTPELTPKSQEAFAADRSGFLAKVKARSGGANYVLTQAAPCENPDDPLPCPPLTESTGIMLTVDGPLKPGTMTASLNLDAILRGWDGKGSPPWMGNSTGWTDAQISQAKAAAKILSTFDRIRRHPHAGDYEAVLASDYGVRMNGNTLLFDVRVGVDDSVDGVIRTDIEGVSLLGVSLEFTAVSSLKASLPPAALPPGLGGPSGSLGGMPGIPLPGIAGTIAGARGLNAAHLIGLDGATLVGLDGGSLIGLDGGSLVGLDGATLIGNDGGTLIGLDGGSLVGLDGGTLIGLDGGSLVGLDGGTLVGLDGGTLVDNRGGALAGHVEVPFPDRPKYQLAAYTEVVYPSTGRARIVTYDGTPLSEWVPLDAQGNFYLYKLPRSPLFFRVDVEIGGYTLAANAIAPKDKLTTVKVNAASTVVTGMIAAKAPTLFDIALSLLSLGGYNQDLSTVQALLTQQQAQDAVTKGQAGAQAVATQIDPLDSVITGFLNLLTAPPMVAGLTETWAGTGATGYNDGKRTVADSFTLPTAIDSKDSGNKVVVVDGDRIRTLNSGRTDTTFGPLLAPPSDWGTYGWTSPQFSDIQAVGNELYVSDFANNAIFKILPNGTITTVAHTSAGISGFHRMADGTIYAVLPGFDRLVRIVGTVETTVYGSRGDYAKLKGPLKVTAFDADTLIIADTKNHRVVAYEIAMDMAATIAGDPAAAGAPYQEPQDVAVSADGWVYVADKGSHAIRRTKFHPITHAQLAEELVAGGTQGHQDGATAKFNDPVSLVVDGQHVYIADKSNKRIRRTRPN